MEIDTGTSNDVSVIQDMIFSELGSGNISSEALNVSIGVDPNSLNVSGKMAKLI